jgi:hypothetical protein
VVVAVIQTAAPEHQAVIEQGAAVVLFDPLHPLQQVGELLREYEEEFLVAVSAHEVFDVLGLHGAIGGAGLEPWLGGA